MSTDWVEELGDLHTVNDEPEDDGSTEYMDAEEAAIAREFYEAMMVASRESPRAKQGQAFVVGVSDLGFCLAGDAEIPTRQGIVGLGSLAGETVEILVPQRSGTTVGSKASWREVEVKSFGVQPLLKITLTRPGGSTKVVHATADHQWFVTRRARNQGYVVTKTCDLRAGDRMKEATAGSPLITSLVPMAAVMGFIYADGSKRHSDSEVTIYHRSNKIDSTIVPLLRVASSQVRETKQGTRFRGFPMSWKDVPDFSRESSAFALSWLAGYFAGDGSVDANGGCQIQSSSRVSIEAARFAATCAGGSYSPIRTRVLSGGLGLAPNEEREVFTISLRRRSLPEWFFLNTHHRARVTSLSDKASADASWSVTSVEATDRVEKVYCAVVPGVEAFVLTENLVSHNCPERVRRMLDGQVPEPTDVLPAFLGTAIGDHAERAYKAYRPNIIIQGEVEVAFKIRVDKEAWTIKVPGHPDIIDPERLLMLDAKSSYLLADAERQGPDLQKQFQRHLYGVGAWNAGYFPVGTDLSDVRVGNVWIDRSGQDRRVHVDIEPLDLDVVAEAEAWLEDVVYHLINKEAAQKVPPRSMCEKVCGYAADCRGFDIASEGLIEDPEVLSRVGMYVEGKAKASEGERLKKAAKQALVEMGMIGGSTPDGQQVVWTHVNESYVPEHTRSGYSKLEVKPLPKAKRK